MTKPLTCVRSHRGSVTGDIPDMSARQMASLCMSEQRSSHGPAADFTSLLAFTVHTLILTGSHCDTINLLRWKPEDPPVGPTDERLELSDKQSGLTPPDPTTGDSGPADEPISSDYKPVPNSTSANAVISPPKSHFISSRLNSASLCPVAVQLRPAKPTDAIFSASLAQSRLLELGLFILPNTTRRIMT